MFLLTCLPLAILVSLVHSLQNATVEDTDPSIVYFPSTSWLHGHGSDVFSGASLAYTFNKSAIATFNFTGLPLPKSFYGI